MGGLSDTEPQRSVEAQRLHDRVRGLLFGEPAAPTHLGRYEVGERLGAGGMGIVYAGYDPELGRRVAIKLVRPDRAGDLAGRSARDRLLREAQAMARLSSPHTVTVYEAGTYGDQVFVVMEFVAGMTLSQWLLRSPRSWREVQAIFLEAGRGLLAAHRAGLVHRDFKPDNVLLGDDGRARVADFGLAAAVAEAVASGAGVGVAAGRVQGADAGVVEVVAAGRAHGVDEAGEGAGAGAGRVMPDDEGSPRSRAFAERGSASGTIAGAQIGSLHYMSPEQHRGAAVDARSDQFSFCVSLWEALYGASPFPATTVDELRERVLAGAVARPLEAGRVPAALRRIALRGLQVDPARRYPDMAALLAALERVGRRRGALVIGLGAATLVGALALGLVIRRPDPRDLCDDAGAEAAAAWGDPQRAAVRRAFQGTGRADAAAVYAQVAERLDAYASEWVGARRDACRAANLAEETGASEVAHLQIACLDRGLGELRALVDAFVRDPDELVGNAVKAAVKLRPLASCRDRPEQALLVAPGDPIAAAKTQDLADRLDAVAALLKAGDVEGALPLARAAVDEARRLDHDFTIAEALVLLGSLQSQAQEYAAAEATLFEAALAAERGGNPGALARARTELVVTIGYGQGRTDEALRWGALAVNALRPGADAGVEVRLRTALGLVHARRGDRPAAEAELGRALALAESTLGPDHIGVATILTHLAAIQAEAGERGSARALLRRALTIRTRTLGATHPDTALTQASLDAVSG